MPSAIARNDTRSFSQSARIVHVIGSQPLRQRSRPFRASFEQRKQIDFFIRMVVLASGVEIAHDVHRCLPRLLVKAVRSDMGKQPVQRFYLVFDAAMTGGEHLDRVVEIGRGRHAQSESSSTHALINLVSAQNVGTNIRDCT